MLGSKAQSSISDAPPIVTTQYRELAEQLRYFVAPGRPVTIAIDGRSGTGKSTLARFLSWQLGIPSIETDLLLSEQSDSVSHDLPALLQLLVARYGRKQPVIVDGILALRTLGDVGVSPEFLIYLDSDGNQESSSLQREFEKYEAAYEPRERADWILSVQQA